MNFFKGLYVVPVAFLLGTTMMIDIVMPAVAMPTQDTFTQDTLVARSTRRRRLNFRVGVRPSNRRIGGISRTAMCGDPKKPLVLTSLVPPPQNQTSLSSNPAQEPAFVDKTSLDRPTFFINVPSLPPTAGQFTLQNESGTRQLYSVNFQLTGKSGIVGITIPNSVPALQVGQKYFWQVRIACDSDDPTSNVFVRNWVERITPPASAGNDRLVTLSEQGIWQDVVTLLALQRYQKPQDPAIAEDWANLMEDAGLSQFKQTAIVQIVKN